ncbi:MBL fold metallo-hydrolase [Nocardioides sp. CER19]|uniref:MBL fold metallo-hydrolase n=1 Tax=Nocardioides sp. CER19 TaxID=3038538 RepID=UPI002448900C|nr:MBL fold metallo-hydrolase [Nocardioides sp. CER19]MDH2414009.1 MBL fold metallo-hydrolase [Nocardioides sp. CER19]
MTPPTADAALTLTIVGCSGSYPGPESAASCYLVEADGSDGQGGRRTWRILLDLGNGALGALQRYVDPLSIDAVLLSHLHADHCIDMTSYYVLRRYHPSGHQPPIPVWGPKGTARRLARAYDLPRKPGMQEEFEFHQLRGGFEVGPFRITPVEVDHPVPAYAFRIEVAGTVLAYTGDTGPTDALLDLARDVDLLLAEASFRHGDDNPESLHLTGVQAGEVAAKAGAKRLVLTHIPPWHDSATMLAEAGTAYDGPAELAVAGAVYPLPG